MKRAKITSIHAAAKNRKPGYLEAYFRHGHVEGEFIFLPDHIHAAIREEFSLAPRPASVPGFRQPQMQGAGDLVSKIATPIARTLKMGCIDKTTNDLKPESPCAKRRAALNKLLPFRM